MEVLRTFANSKLNDTIPSFYSLSSNTHMRFFLLIISLFSVQFLMAQDPQPGGFIYGWDNYDNSDTPGLGAREVVWNTEGLRDIPHAPPEGIHPRIFFGPDDIPDIKSRLENLESGQAVRQQIHAYTLLMLVGTGNYNQNADYALDDFGNRWVGNAGHWSAESHYSQLVAENPNVWTDVEIKRKHITASIMSMLALECLLFENEMNEDVGVSYADLAQDLAKALTFWASLAIDDPLVEPSSNHFNHFGGMHTAITYDLLHGFMTEDQRVIVRQAIAKIIPDEPRHGAYLPAYTCTSNWATLNSFEIIPNLVLEGEAGYKPELTERWMRTLHTFVNYGWYSSGAGYEGLGKNYLFMPTLIACAKRGYSLLGHPHVRAYGQQFLPAITQPFGHAFTSYDVWGGSGEDAETGGYKFKSSDAIGLKWIFPNDPTVDFMWKNYIQQWIKNDSEGYVYQQILPDDSYYNYFVPAAAFALDYSPGDWQAEADATVEIDYFADDRGLAVMKSSTDKNALGVQFHCRQDMGGHTHGDRNDFTLSGLGRIWVRKSYGGSNFQPTWFHSTILIDDEGMGVGDPDGDKCRQPGKILEYTPDEAMTKVAGDATYAYSWEWHWSPQTGDHPWLGTDDWTAIEETWNDFQYTPRSEAHFNMPFYEFPHWHQEGKFERMVKRPFNPMEKVMRTVAMVKGENPFVLVVDDLKKDANTHNFKWLAQLARDLTIEETVVNLNNDNYRNDVILHEPATTGNRRLLVRILNNEGYDGSAPNAVMDTLEYFDYFNGTPYNDNPNLDRPRLIVESNSVEPDFKIMLFPFVENQELPTTNWNTTRDTLTVIFNEEEQIFAFPVNNDGRTEIEIVEDIIDDVNEIAVSEIAVFPNPTSDFINISLSKMPLQPLEMVIFDAKGSKVKKVVLTEQKTVIDLKKLESGNYFYEIGNEGAIIHSGKILKE